MKKELIAERNPKSPIAETFRTLRTNIQFMTSQKSLKSLLITSTVPGEGKTWVASNLAITFAQAGKKVILIDADMRKGRLHKLFQIDSTPGLSNYLSGVDDAGKLQEADIYKYIKQTEVENLFIIPAGNYPPNPSELLTSELTVKMIEKLKELFDIVILDGTPSLLVSDAVILSRIVDSTIIVSAHKITKKDGLKKVQKAIENVGGNIAGVVLNKIPVNIDKYESTYYYSSSDKKREHGSSRESSNNDYKSEENSNTFKSKQEEITKQLENFLNNKNQEK